MRSRLSGQRFIRRGGVRHTAIIGAHLTANMVDDRRKTNPDNPGLKVVPKRRAQDKGGNDREMPLAGVWTTKKESATTPDAETVAVVNGDGEAVLLPLNPSSNMAQKIIAIAAAAAICYFGKPILVPMVCSLLLGFMLDPIVRGLQRLRVPRAAAAFLVMLTLTAGLWGVSYFSYVRVAAFVKDLPQYSQKIKNAVGKVREQSQKLERAKQAVAPDQAQEKNAVKVQNVTPGWQSASAAAGSLSEAFLEFTFVLVLTFFGLTWSEHMRRSLVKMFKPDDRRAAHRALGRISGMVRGFIVGNLIVGMVMAAANSAVFWKIGVPNALLVGILSGFVSLVPYLGVPLAALPPLAVSLGSISTSKIAIILVTVFLVHILSMNFLFPKVLGEKMKLNPLVVTASLLIWGFIWGPIGLILAVPIAAAFKIVCDHVDTWRPLGELMGDR
jgi:predicted PurR-regulated permease PerM